MQTLIRDCRTRHGTGGPWLFGVLIEGGSSAEIFWGYLLGAVLMIAAALACAAAGGPSRGSLR